MLRAIIEKWKQFAAVLAQINTGILLSVVFFLIIIPYGLLLRLFGKSVLKTPDSGSLWQKKSSVAAPEKPF